MRCSRSWKAHRCSLRSERYIDTTHVLFICGGAFVGLEAIMSKTHGYGFISVSDEDNQNILDRLNTRVKPTDLFELRSDPGVHGTSSDRRDLPGPDAAMLIRIMVEPRNSSTISSGKF